MSKAEKAGGPDSVGLGERLKSTFRKAVPLLQLSVTVHVRVAEKEQGPLLVLVV